MVVAIYVLGTLVYSIYQKPNTMTGLIVNNACAIKVGTHKLHGEDNITNRNTNLCEANNTWTKA